MHSWIKHKFITVKVNSNKKKKKKKISPSGYEQPSNWREITMINT